MDLCSRWRLRWSGSFNNTCFRNINRASGPVRGSGTRSSMVKGYRLSASTGIHKGDREYQQDQVALLSHPRFPGCVLAVVADGMGGRSGGRKASDQVMMTARQLFERYSPDHDDATALLRQMVTWKKVA